MKPAPFAYVRPTALAQVLELLARHGEAARILAGGQSLIATLNMRLSAPELLIDINGIGELGHITVAGDRLRIGALVRHAALGASEEVRRHAPLLARAVPFIAHPAIRNRGTIGGSLAFADPAAELPACVVALDATLELTGPHGVRKLPARAFFTGLYQTALAPGELLTAVELPIGDREAWCGFDELARRHGDYAMVGLAVQGRRAGAGFAALSAARAGSPWRASMAASCTSAIARKRGSAISAAARAASVGSRPPGARAGGCGQRRRRVVADPIVGDQPQRIGGSTDLGKRGRDEAERGGAAVLRGQAADLGLRRRERRVGADAIARPPPQAGDPAAQRHALQRFVQLIDPRIGAIEAGAGAIRRAGLDLPGGDGELGLDARQRIGDRRGGGQGRIDLAALGLGGRQIAQADDDLSRVGESPDGGAGRVGGARAGLRLDDFAQRPIAQPGLVDRLAGLDRRVDQTGRARRAQALEHRADRGRRNRAGTRTRP
ncbi:MAG: FAD binding domain-containing protein [Pseudomonadota bacterium]